MKRFLQPMRRLLQPLRSIALDLERESSPKLVLGAIVALGAALRLVAFRGFIGSDDRAYAELAHALVNGSYPAFDASSSVFQNRLGLVAPVALAIRSFGTSEWVFLLYPFAISLASIWLAYFFGRALFGTAAGLLAAAMIALLPIELSMATQLVPDLAASFWANLGVFAIWSATHSKTGRRALTLGAAAGLCFGIAWLHKSSVAYLAPFVGGVLLVSSWRQPRIGAAALAGTAAASLAILGAESVAYLQLSGDAAFRFTSLPRNFEQTSQYWFIEGGLWGWQPGEYTSALLDRLFVSGPRSIFLSRAYAHLPLSALLVGLLAICVRDARQIFCGAWFGSLLLLFNFATTSLEYYKPLILMQRYLYPLVLPAVLLVSSGLLSLRRGALPRWTLPVSRTAVLLLVCIPIARGYVAGIHRELGRPPGIAGVRAAASLLGPNDPIVTDDRSVRDFRFLWGFPERTRLEVFGHDVSDISPGSYVFINRERIRLNQQLNGEAPPKFWHALPNEWELVRRVPDGELYRVPQAAGRSLQLGHLQAPP